MEEQLISFETAKLAKEKGFNIGCKNKYVETLEHALEMGRGGDCTFPHIPTRVLTNSSYEKWDIVHCDAPTQSLLAKWLREVHNCFIDILPHRDGDSKNKQWKNKKDVFWTVEVDYYGKNFEIELTDDSDFTQHFNKTYEEALEIGLYQALKLIK